MLKFPFLNLIIYHHYLCHTADVRTRPENLMGANITTDADAGGCCIAVQNILLLLVGSYFLLYFCHFMFT